MNRRLTCSFVTLLFVSLLFAGCGSSADSAANRFMSLLVEGKHLEVQQMLSKDMHSMATMLGGVSNGSLNSYYRSGNFRSFILTRTEQTEDSVRYKVTAITKDGTSHQDFIDIVREDGNWKVARF
jgi:hypothetical protein